MNKTGFIKILEQYKYKALANLHAEMRAVAVTLIPQDLMRRMQEMTKGIAALNEAHTEVERLLSAEESMKSLFGKGLSDLYGGIMRYSRVDKMDVTNSTVERIVSEMSGREPYRTQKADLVKKFDDAIARAKKLNSVSSLTELARLLDIPLGDDDTVVPDEKPVSVLDVPFVKSEIKKAVMLA
jgi:hypothetical protein